MTDGTNLHELLPPPASFWAESAGADLARLATRIFSDDPRVRLRSARALRAYTEVLRCRSILSAVDDGLSWSEIGAELGVSKQAAWERAKTCPDTINERDEALRLLQAALGELD
jgi:hypothetical protein